MREERLLEHNVKQAKRNVDTLKQKKRDLEDKRPRSTDDVEKSKLSAEIESTEKEIYEAGKAIDEVNDELGPPALQSMRHGAHMHSTRSADEASAVESVRVGHDEPEPAD